MQSFAAPGKLYFKKGCLPVALRELTEVYHAKRVRIVADEEMLRGGRLALVTKHLHEMGLEYAVNAANFDFDCVIGCGSPKSWQNLPAGKRIIIPTSFASTEVSPWRSADMVILDEDLLESVPLPEILEAAVQSLRGDNASDYTLAWAVQAMRLVFAGGDLLHAAALSGLAKAIAEPDSVGSNLLPDAAEALGMTAEALTNKIERAVNAAR